MGLGGSEVPIDPESEELGLCWRHMAMWSTGKILYLGRGVHNGNLVCIVPVSFFEAGLEIVPRLSLIVFNVITNHGSFTLAKSGHASSNTY